MLIIVAMIDASIGGGGAGGDVFVFVLTKTK